MRTGIFRYCSCRPLIAKNRLKWQVEGANAVAHGATGKGNDQVRFDFVTMHYAGVKVISPWKDKSS